MIRSVHDLRAWLLCTAGLAFSCERGELLGSIDEVPGRLRPPTRVEVLSDPGARDTDPTFRGDLLELYFMSDRTDSKDLWRSTRANARDGWGAPELVAELNSPQQDENPQLAEDGLSIWFYTDRDRSRGTIWRSRRASLDAPWEEPAPVEELAHGSDTSDVAFGVAESGLAGVLASRRPGTSNYDLYLYERDAPAGAFEERRVLEEVCDDADDFDGKLAQDGAFLTFHSNRNGSEDLFIATRAGDVFDPPEPVLELNTEAVESAPVFSRDLGYVMFSSDRAGTLDIYETTRVPER